MAGITTDSTGNNLALAGTLAVTSTSTFGANSCFAGIRPWTDPTCFGALGNGSANDTTALQAAVTASCAAGGEVVIPTGTYIVDQPQSSNAPIITIPSGCAGSGKGLYVRGEGSNGQGGSFVPQTQITVVPGASPGLGPVFQVNNSSFGSNGVGSARFENLSMSCYNQCIEGSSGGDFYFVNNTMRTSAAQTNCTTAGCTTDTAPLVFYGGLEVWVKGGTYSNANTVGCGTGDCPTIVISTDASNHSMGLISIQDAVLFGEVNDNALTTPTSGWGLVDMQRDIMEALSSQPAFKAQNHGSVTSFNSLTLDTVSVADSNPFTPLIELGGGSFYTGIHLRNNTPSVLGASIQVLSGTLGYCDVTVGSASSAAGGVVDGSGNPLIGCEQQTYTGNSYVGPSNYNPNQGYYSTFWPPFQFSGSPIEMAVTGESNTRIAIDPLMGVLQGPGGTVGGYDLSWRRSGAQTMGLYVALADPPTNITATPLAGGSLTSGTHKFAVVSSISASNCGSVTNYWLTASAALSAGNLSATVTWTPPANTASITGYCVIIDPNTTSAVNAFFVAGAATSTYNFTTTSGAFLISGPVINNTFPASPQYTLGPAGTGGTVGFGGGGGINPPVGDIGGTTGSPTVVGLEGLTLPTLGGSTGYLYDSAGTLSLSTSASNFTTGTLPHAQLPTLLSADIPNNAANTSGNAATATTATALAGTPTLCTTGQAPTGILSSGNATGCASIASGLTTQTNGTNNISQSTLNLINSAAFNGLTFTFTNTGTGTVQAGFSGTLGNAGLTNPSTTINGVTATLGSTASLPFSVIGSNDASQVGINFIASTVNAVGLTVTPSNPSSNNVKFEITGTVPGGTVTHSTGNLIQGESVVGSGASVNDVATSPAYLDCSQFSGADWGLIARACLTALNSLNSTSGVADMRGVSNATTASINPLAQSATLPASGKMLLGGGTWNTNVPIAVHNDWSIEGINVRGVDGQVGTTIKAGASFQATYNTGTITVGTTGANEVITGSGTTWTSSMVGCAFVSPGGSSTANNTFGIITAVNSATSISLGWGANNGSGAPAASAYDIYCPIYAAGSGGASSSGDQFGMNLTNINLDCNNVAGCVGYMNWYGNQGTRAFNVGLHGYTNIGADYEFQAQNFDESSFEAMTPGTSCTTSTIPLVVRLGAESTSGFATLSMNQCPGTVPAVGIDDQTNGLVIRNADLEHVGIGVLIGGNVTCPVACPIGPKVNVQGGVFVNVHCLAGVTTCGQISSAEGTPKNLTFIDMQATSTNMLIDGPNGNTITAGGSETTLGLYQTGEAGVVVASTSVQANAQPKTLPADAVLIANLPTAATSATAVAVVPNGSTSTDCTIGGGSNHVTCYNTGTAWVPVGGGSGGGGSPGGLTNSVQYNAGGGTFGGLNSPTSAGQYFVQFNVPGSSGVVPTASVGGVVVNAQSSATPSVTQANDTQMVQTTNSTTSTALSIPSASGLSAAFVFAHCNTGSVVATDTPTTSTVNGNATIKLQGAVVNPSCALFWTDPSFNYWAAVIPPTDANGRISAAGMPAFTGDATTSAGSLAITVTKINGTAFAGTNGDVVSFGASNIPADSGVAVANLTTQTANGAANDVCTYTGTNKLCVPGPVTNAMLSNSSVTVNTQTCTLGSSCTITAGLAFPATVSGTATSGGIPYFSNTTTLTSSALLATNALVTGGGAGGAPATGNGDFTYATHTLTASSSGILDLSATAPTAGLKLPSAAGAVPTADGFIGVNTTNHTLVSGSNGTTIVQAAAATGTNTATTCSNQVVTAVSAIAIPTCTTITPAYAAGNTTGSGNFVLATSATLVTPALGTPSALVLTNATGTPTSINLTNASALPCSATPALTGAVTTSAGSCATSFQSSPSFTTPNIGAATGTSLLATGIVDGEAPVTVTTGTSATLGGTYNSGYTFNEEGTAATAVTYTLPTAAAGKQYCVSNAYNGSAANTGTLELLTSASGQFIIFTDGTLSATGGFVISGGAARDAACVVGVDSTHWALYVQSGTWTKH